MNKSTAEISRNLKYIKEKGFLINDKEKIIGYLEKVGLHRLKRYFNVVNDYSGTDFQEVINAYIFDKSLRSISITLLETIENAFKNQFIIYCENYLDPFIYKEKYRDSRLGFLYSKSALLKRNDPEVLRFLRKDGSIPIDIFVDKLNFGELLKIFFDLNKNIQKRISSYFGINIVLFRNWLQCLGYLRNLCSHGENVFNRKFTYSIKAVELFDVFSINQNNQYVSYFYVLTVFNSILTPNYNWEDKIFRKADYYKINLEKMGIKKETFQSQLESEAWKVLVLELYEKYK